MCSREQPSLLKWNQHENRHSPPGWPPWFSKSLFSIKNIICVLCRKHNISEEHEGEKKAVQAHCLPEGLASTPYTGGVGITVTLSLPVNTQLPISPSGSLVLWGFWGASFHSASDWAP